MTDRIDILTPVGRLVQGDCFKGRTQDMAGRPLTVKTGPNAGQPRTDYYMALAVPKTDPGAEQLIGQIKQAARNAFPGLFDAAGNCTNSKFAFKYVDGDSLEKNEAGRAWNSIEGFPGHYVFKFSGGFAPECYSAGGASVLVEPDSIKRGYYIRIYGSVAGNSQAANPGVYLNHSMVELVGYGEEIKSGPDGATVFGSAPVPALPPGATTTPAAPATPIAAPPATGVQPAPNFLDLPAATPAPPVQPERFIHPNGQSFDRAQLKASGWTDEQINALPRG
jgi:hypothetical protein